MIANTFLEVADALETGQYGKKPVIGFASEGSEHGQDNIEEAMKIAEMKGLKAVLIEGEDLHKKMEEMLDSGEIDGAVTMHYPFPIGASACLQSSVSASCNPAFPLATSNNIGSLTVLKPL